MDKLPRHVAPVVFRCAPRARLADALPQFRLSDQPFDGVGERLGVLRLHEEARHISLYDTLVAMDVGGDDRAARGHRLEEHDPERLLPRRRRDVNVRGLVEARLVRILDAAGEEHVGETLPMHEAADVADLWPAADDYQPRLWIFGLETRVRARDTWCPCAARRGRRRGCSPCRRGTRGTASRERRSRRRPRSG